MSSSSQGARTIQDYELEEEKEYNCRKCGKGFSKERKRDQHEQKKGAHINLMAQWEFRKKQEDLKLSKENILQIIQENSWKGQNGVSVLRRKIGKIFHYLKEKKGSNGSVVISYRWVKGTPLGSRNVGMILEFLVEIDMAERISNRSYRLTADTEKLEEIEQKLKELSVEEGFTDEGTAELKGWL